MATSSDDDPHERSDLLEIDEAFRKAFGLLAASHRAQTGLTPKALSDAITPRVGQGNSGGIVDLEKGAGWVHVTFAREAFREVGVPNADLFADAYQALKQALNGRSEPYYRARKRAARLRTTREREAEVGTGHALGAEIIE